MRVHALIRRSYRAGWGVIDTIRDPIITMSTQRTGWVGDATLTSTTDYPLGAELQLIADDTGETLWLGRITDRSYRSTDGIWTYRVRGICEHFLDLPFPYTSRDLQQRRDAPASQLWQFHVAETLRYHTPRYQPVYELSMASWSARDYQLRTVRDAYKIYQSIIGCMIVPEVLPTGRVRMYLLPMPMQQDAVYVMPREATYEIEESIAEIGTRISIADPARQLIQDRRIADPAMWWLIVPTGASATVTIQDATQRGYLGAHATRLDVTATSVLQRVGLRSRETIRAPRNPQGQRIQLRFGAYVRGSNARVRFNVSGNFSSETDITNYDTWTDISYTLTPNTDDLLFTVEIRPIDITDDATLIIDNLFCGPGTEDHRSRDYPPHLEVRDTIPAYLTAGEVTAINNVVSIGGDVYDLYLSYPLLPTGITGSPVQVLRRTQVLSGTVVSRQSATILRVQTLGGAPSIGDMLYLRHGKGADSEYLYDTHYMVVDTPATIDPASIANLVESVVNPQKRLTAQVPVGEGLPIPRVGQVVAYPITGEMLPIYEVDLSIVSGHITHATIRAGSPELTMRGLLRRLDRTLGRRRGV